MQATTWYKMHTVQVKTSLNQTEGVSVWIKVFKSLPCIVRYPMHRMRYSFNKCLTLQHKACVSGNDTDQAFGYSLV